MCEAPNPQNKMVRAILDTDSAFLVVFDPVKLGEEEKEVEGSPTHAVKSYSVNLNAGQLTTLTSAVNQFVGRRIDFILLDYLRLLEAEYNAKKNSNGTGEPADVGSTDRDGADDSSAQLAMHIPDRGDDPSEVQLGDPDRHSPDMDTVCDDTGHDTGSGDSS